MSSFRSQLNSIRLYLILRKIGNSPLILFILTFCISYCSEFRKLDIFENLLIVLG